MAHESVAVAVDRRAAPLASPPRWRRKVIERSADVALAALPTPLDMLDVGCGSGALLRELVLRVPYGESYVGIDPDPERIAVARRTPDPRVSFVLASVESLPFPDASFDLVAGSLCFDGWADQPAAVRELARVVRDRGRVVVVERAAGWLPGHGRRRSPGQIVAVLEQAGLRVERRETLHRAALVAPLVRAFIAFR